MSERNKTFEKIFSGTEDTQGTLEPRQIPPGEATSPLGAARGFVPSRLVGPLWLVCPTSSAYKFPKNPKLWERSTKILFRHRKLLSPQDPIWGTF